MLHLRPIQQSITKCGPACLKMVLEYYGFKLSERALAKLSGWRFSVGTSAAGMAKAARALGLSAQIKDECSIAELRRLVMRRGIPVIVSWFSSVEGHYSVVVAVTRDAVVLMDPELGHHRSFKLNNFRRLWFDLPEPYLKRKEDLTLRRAIVIEPRAAKRRHSPARNRLR